MLASIALTAALTLAPVELPADGWVAIEQPAVAGTTRLGCHGDGAVRLGSSSRGWRFNETGNRSEGAQETFNRFTIFIEMRAGEPQDLIAYTPDCRVENADVANAMDMETAQMARLLSDVLARDTRRGFTARAVTALAHIDDPAVDSMLDVMAGDLSSERRAEDALFWLAQRRGEAGRRMVRAYTEEPWPLDHRKHALMMLALSKHPDALDHVRQLARTAGEPDIRAAAVTGLGLAKAPGATADLHGIFLADAHPDVREQVIFGLSQLDSREAAKVLAEIAREKRFGRHRQTALFWLTHMRGGESEAVLDELMSEIL